MWYRYDENDSNCESFRYARDRATVFYHKLKQFYCGDRSDLEQTAMMAVVELAKVSSDLEKIPEKELLKAVDNALSKETKSNFRNPTSIPLNINVHRKQRRKVTPEAEKILIRFRSSLDTHLDQEHQEIMWNYFIFGITAKKQCEAILAVKTRHSWNWVAPTPESIQAKLDKAVKIIRERVADEVIEDILTLPYEMEEDDE